jgi:hypothetical protein
MPRSFKLPALNFDLRSHMRDPQHAVRIVLGALLLANLIGVWFVFQTPGGTPEQLERELVSTRRQLAARGQALAKLKKTVERVTLARQSSDKFLDAYFLPRRYAYSMLEVDFAEASRSAGIRPKERSYSYEPIEGSDTLGMLNINAAFEGTFADLIEFVNAVDRSKRLLIIEQLQAQPQQGASTLSITVKLNAFFRMEGPQDAPELPALNFVSNAAPPVTAPPVTAPKPMQPGAQPQPKVVSPQGNLVPPPPPTVVGEPRSGPAAVDPRIPRRRVPIAPKKEDEQ